MGKLLGQLRAVFLVSVCCVGAFLFAYDTGIIGGILTLDSFKESFRYSQEQSSDISSNSNSLLQAGGTIRPVLHLEAFTNCYYFNRSLLFVLFRMAIYQEIWSPMVYCARVVDL